MSVPITPAYAVVRGESCPASGAQAAISSAMRWGDNPSVLIFANLTNVYS